MDAVKASIDMEKASNPKMIGLDADTFKLDKNYITNMAEKLNTVDGFLTANWRWYDANTAKGDEWAFILERLYAAGRMKEFWEWDYYSDGFLS
jgi:hypothetical protein